MLHQSKCDQILNHIITVVRPIRVVIFGSAAKKSTRANDLDFLVVVANGQDTRGIAQSLYYTAPRLGVSLDFVVVTEDEAQAARQDFWSVVCEAEKNGKELYVAKTA